MSKETAVTVATPAVALRQDEILRQMTEEGRAKAKEMRNKICESTRSQVLAWWDVGKMINGALSAADSVVRYGQDYARQLAVFFGFNADGNTTEVYRLRNFATAFTRQFVATWTSKVFPNGKVLSLKHWVELSRRELTSPQQEAVLSKCIAGGWSAELLSQAIAEGTAPKNIRKGGRHLQRPQSLSAGIQAIEAAAQRIVKLDGVIEDWVMKPVRETPPDRLDDQVLQRFTTAQEMVDSAGTSLDDIRDKLTQGMQHVSNVIAKRNKGNGSAAADDGAEAAVDAEDPAQYDSGGRNRNKTGKAGKADKAAKAGTGKKTPRAPSASSAPSGKPRPGKGKARVVDEDDPEPAKRKKRGRAGVA